MSKIPETKFFDTSLIDEVVNENRRVTPEKFNLTLLKWGREIQTIEDKIRTIINNPRERQFARDTLRGIILELYDIKKQDYSIKEIGDDGQKNLLQIIDWAKDLDDKLTTRTEKIFKKTGKILTGLAAAVSLGFAVQKYEQTQNSRAEYDKIAEQARADIIPKIPETMAVMGEETIRHQGDTSEIFADFVTAADKNFHHPDSKHALPLITEDFTPNDPKADFEKKYIEYEPQISHHAPNSREDLVPRLADATGRSQEQMNFVIDIVNGGCFKTPANFGGMSGVIPVGNHIYNSERHPEWYQKQYEQTVAFVDRIYENKLKKLSKADRDSSKPELIKFINAEIEVRAYMQVIVNGLKKNRKEIFSGHEKTKFDPGSEAIFSNFKKSLDVRDQALEEFYNNLKTKNGADAFEGASAKLIMRLQTLSQIRDTFLRQLEKEKEEGIFTGGDFDTLVRALGEIQHEIQKLIEAFKILEPPQRTTPEGAIAVAQK